MRGAIAATAGSVAEGLWGAGIIHPGRDDEPSGRETGERRSRIPGRRGKRHDRRSTE